MCVYNFGPEINSTIFGCVCVCVLDNNLISLVENKLPALGTRPIEFWARLPHAWIYPDTESWQKVPLIRRVVDE